MPDKLEPLGDRVVIRPEVPPEEMQSGLVIPEIARKKPTRGTVIGVGEAVTTLKVGDLISYQEYSGVPTDLNGTEVLVLHLADVIARVVPDLAA